MTAKIVAIVAADTHLAPGAWVKHPQVAGDSYRAFKHITSLARDNGVPLFLAGDVFDVNRPDSRSVRVAQDCLKDVTCFYIQGQHEMADPPWLTLTNAVHLHSNLVDVGPFVFYGIDFSRKIALLEILSKVPKQANTLLMHQVWGDHLAGKAEGEAKFSQIPDVDCVFTGDYHHHKQTSVVNANKYELTVFSPGSTCMQAVDENSEKFVYGLYDDGSVESIAIPGRQVTRGYIHTDNCVDKLAAVIKARALQFSQEERPLLIVKVRDDVVNAVLRLEKLAETTGYILAMSVVRTPAVSHVEVGSSFGNVSLLSCLETDVDPDDPVYKTCYRLLATTRPHQEEIESIREEHLHDHGNATGAAVVETVRGSETEATKRG